MARKPLYNAELQNDLEGEDFNIQNLNQIDVVQTGTVYVDSGLATEIGKINSAMAFRTLEAALAAAPAGSTIIMRPGIYAYDGILQVKRARVKILGQGATISPVTPGEIAGLLITASYVLIDGITFDGGLTGSPSDSGTVIEVSSATNVSLSNLIIREQHGSAITLTDRYGFAKIDNCDISKCYKGVVGGITTANNITGITISNCSIQTCRSGGILLHGNDNVDQIADVRITGNDIVNCDTSGVSAPAIDTSAGLTDVIISNNYLSRCYYGVYVTLSRRVTISSNSFSGINGIMTQLDGCQTVTVSSNLMDGSNASTGNPLCPVGIQMVGYYSISGNDTGPYIISGNMITGIANNGKFINTANANDITIASNQMSAWAYIYAISFNNLKISGNMFTISGTDPVIALDAAERGWVGCTINDNQFKLTGTRGRLIQTNDSLAMGQSNITIVGNWSTQGQVYASGIYDNVAGAEPSRAFLHSNTPEANEFERDGGAPDKRNGWVNDYNLSLISNRINIPTDSPTKYQVGGSQVVGDRITGWTLPTGTQTRTTFDPATVTLAALGQRVNALIHDLHITTGHGLIGLYS